MTNHSTFVRSINERQALYRVSSPVRFYDSESDSESEATFVVASKSMNWTGDRTARGSFGAGFLGGNPAEILVFPASESGEVLSYGEIGGSYNEESHESALADMGFPVRESTREAS